MNWLSILTKYPAALILGGLALLSAMFTPARRRRKPANSVRVKPAITKTRTVRKTGKRKSTYVKKAVKPAWMVKGSAAAKAHMAKLRKMR
jgi:hypothetical protein